MYNRGAKEACSVTWVAERIGRMALKKLDFRS